MPRQMDGWTERHFTGLFQVTTRGQIICPGGFERFPVKQS